MKETNLQDNMGKIENKVYDKEEKIIKYDVETGETTVVNMELLRGKNDNSSNYTEPYNPLNLPFENHDKSNRVMIDSFFTKISNTLEFPYIVTCRISVDGGLGSGTGFLVGPNMMLTAAHVIYDEDDGNRVRSLTVYPGYNTKILNINGKEYSSGWQAIYRSSIWLETHNREYDWALVELKEDLGNQLGWYGIKEYNSGSFLNDLKVKLLGYPDRFDNAKVQYYTIGNINEVADRYFMVSMGNSQGMSGGPITPESGEYEYYTVGLISGNKPHLLIDQTYGVRITEYLIDLVRDNINNH